MMISQTLVKVSAKIQAMQQASQQRLEIKKLSNHLLEDVGLTRIDSGYKTKYSLWDLTKKRDSQDQLLRHPERGSQIKICAFGKCFQYSIFFGWIR